jgi:hypothetical protein
LLLFHNAVALLGQNIEKESFAHALAASAEEGMELLGALLLLRVNLGELRTQPTILIKIQ